MTDDIDPHPQSAEQQTLPPSSSLDNDKAKKGHKNGHPGFMAWLFKGKGDPSLRDVIEGVIENGHSDHENTDFSYEKTLIQNILSMRDLTAVDVMIPRADMSAIDVNAPLEELFALIAEAQHSRYPVYDDTMDNIVGTVHIKDVLGPLAQNKEINIRDLCRAVPVISPAMPAYDLLLQMQESKKHMVLVVDEYGGIDGMVTIGDLIEAIVGNIDDEYDSDKNLAMVDNGDGSITVDAKLDIEDFEEKYGNFVSDEEREELNTLAGVVFSLSGRVPVRGEVLSHPSGVEFEIIDADPRRIKRLKLRNLSAITS